MLQALIGPVSGLIGSWMDKKTEEQRGKSAVAKAKGRGGGCCYGFCGDINCRLGKVDGQG